MEASPAWLGRPTETRRVYLDGSFVSAKLIPGDFDACWDEDGVDFDSIDPVFDPEDPCL